MKIYVDATAYVNNSQYFRFIYTVFCIHVRLFLFSFQLERVLGNPSTLASLMAKNRFLANDPIMQGKNVQSLFEKREIVT